jgi:MbtH protein
MDDDARYEVGATTRNSTRCGWWAWRCRRAGTGSVRSTKDECSAYVDEVWTDMRPRSLREQMDRAQS